MFEYSDGVYPLAPAGYKKQRCTLGSSPPASSDTTFPFLPCRSDASPPPTPQSPGNLSATGMWAEKKTRLRFGFSHARLSQAHRSRELLTFSTHNIKTHFLFAASGTADSFSAFLNEQTDKWNGFYLTVKNQGSSSEDLFILFTVYCTTRRGGALTPRIRLL